MPSSASRKITTEALGLPEDDRLVIATELWRSLGGADEVVADLVALQRSRELAAGNVKAKTQAEVFGNARRALE